MVADGGGFLRDGRILEVDSSVVRLTRMKILRLDVVDVDANNLVPRFAVAQVGVGLDHATIEVGIVQHRELQFVCVGFKTSEVGVLILIAECSATRSSLRIDEPTNRVVVERSGALFRAFVEERRGEWKVRAVLIANALVLGEHLVGVAVENLHFSRVASEVETSFVEEDAVVHRGDDALSVAQRGDLEVDEGRLDGGRRLDVADGWSTEELHIADGGDDEGDLFRMRFVRRKTDHDLVGGARTRIAVRCWCSQRTRANYFRIVDELRRIRNVRKTAVVEHIVEVVHREVVARAERVDLRRRHFFERARVLVELDEIADAETTTILDVALKFCGES